MQLAFSGFHVTAKAVLGQLHPLALAGIRVIVAAPLLTASAALVDRRLPAARDLPHLCLLGLLGVFGNQLLFITGLSHTSATNAAILMPSIPAFAAAVALTLRLERVSAGRLVGMGLAVAGALLLVRVHRFSLDDGTVRGNLMILGNCLAYAAFLVLQRPLLRRLPPLTVIAGAFLSGGAGVLVVSWRQLAALELTALPPAVWWGLAYITIVPTTLGYLVNTWAVQRSSSVLAAAYTTLQPLFSAGLAVYFLSERVGWIEGAGFALIVAGLLQVSRSREG